MNSFAALMIDSDEEDTQKVSTTKKTGEKKTAPGTYIFFFL